MIQPQEIRVGNYYKGASRGNIETVTWQTLRDLSEGKINLLPIPLTEEILLKFGFEMEDEEENILVLKIPSELGYAELKYENNELYLYDGDRAKIGIKIEYAHRLQNFYYELKGIDLKFEDIS